MNQPTAREPVAGDLLVASIMLADGVFNQTVVLVLTPMRTAPSE